MSTSPKAAPFIYLNGPPGVGKLTIGRELVKLLPEARLVDNHLLIDLVRAIFPLGSAEYQALRTNIRQKMLDGIAHSENLSTTFIFTGSNGAKNAISHQIVNEFVASADTRKAPFIFILLSCELEEHMRRATDPERQPGPGKQGKFVNPEGLRKSAVEGTWVDLEGREGVHNLKFDTTGKTPAESAQMIVDIVQGIIAA